MAKLSSDGKSVTVERGDTLSEISQKYYGGASKYKQLAAINGISNPNLIFIGQVIKLEKSSSSSSSSSGTKVDTNKPTIKQFGLVSNIDNTLFATWSWPKSGSTESYEISWTYSTGDGLWFKGDRSNIAVDKYTPSLSMQSTYSIPTNAKKVKFQVKPIAKKDKKKSGNKEVEVSKWTANWSTAVIHTVRKDDAPLEKPAAPTVSIDTYKLSVSYENLDSRIKKVEFRLYQKNSSKVYQKKTVDVVNRQVSHKFSVAVGHDYIVRAKTFDKDGDGSEWSDFSSTVSTIPSTTKITSYKAGSETSVYLEWEKVSTATSYDIQYATKKTYFDTSDQVTEKTGIETTKFDISGLQTGEKYYFRVRATNAVGSSKWSTEEVFVAVGEKPIEPTTWSSTTTAISGEQVTLYWVHNSQDGSDQRHAEVELTINSVTETRTINDKTNRYVVYTTNYKEGTKIDWRVRTCGITNVYGDWSIKRTIDVYAPPSLELTVTDNDDVDIGTLTAFPIKVSALAYPETQAPISYNLEIQSMGRYETVDNLGNPKVVNQDEVIYSDFFDINTALDVTISASDVDLENNQVYLLKCTVAMDSGLTATAEQLFNISWTEVTSYPNATITVDTSDYSVHLKPYCLDHTLGCYQVNVLDDGTTITYERSGVLLDDMYGEPIGKDTYTGDVVYSGVDADGNEKYYCYYENSTLTEGVTLSIYRREYDGRFVEIASGLPNKVGTTAIDPHPSLDFARYRIVSTRDDTGAISYYDLAGYHIGCPNAIFQWNERWTNYETSEDAFLEEEPLDHSMLKLLYNIDVSENTDPDVTLAKYVGRSNPVSYYGTQVGETSSWSMVIDSKDTETIYALRRLSKWKGDVYVREPSGLGYWANIKVTFSQKHTELTIPVTFEITRVEGGI